MVLYLLTGTDGLDEDDTGRATMMMMVMVVMILFAICWSNTAVSTSDHLSDGRQRQLTGNMSH